MIHDIASGKHTKNYGKSNKNHHLSYVKGTEVCLSSVESSWVDFTTRTAIAATGQPWTTAWTPCFFPWRQLQVLIGTATSGPAVQRLPGVFAEYPQRCWRSLNTYGGKTSWQATDRSFESFDRWPCEFDRAKKGFWVWAHRCGKGRPDSKTIKTPMAYGQSPTTPFRGWRSKVFITLVQKKPVQKNRCLHTLPHLPHQQDPSSGVVGVRAKSKCVGTSETQNFPNHRRNLWNAGNRSLQVLQGASSSCIHSGINSDTYWYTITTYVHIHWLYVLYYIYIYIYV